MRRVAMQYPLLSLMLKMIRGDELVKAVLDPILA
jgi:hypothetical protein